MKVFTRLLAAGLLAGFLALATSGCYTTGQFSDFSDDLEPLGPNQFQFVKKGYYTFDDVLAHAMVGATERDCEYFVIAGPQPDSYPIYASGKLKERGRKVYVVTCYPDALSAPAGAVAVKTQNSTIKYQRAKSPIYDEISDQRKVRSMRPGDYSY